jgi:AraC-like DNA-binding protein
MRKALGHYVERPTLDNYLVIYCLAGRGWYRSNGRRWEVAKGQMLFVFRDTAHAYGADKVDPWTIQWVHFNGADVEILLDLAGITPEQPVLSIGERLNVIMLFDQILNTLRAGYNLHYLVNAAAYLRQILSNVALLNTYSPPVAGEALNIDKIIRFMLANLTRPCKLDDLAAQAALSRAHFSRKFRETTGYSPIDYFIRLKIQKACELLESTDLKVGEISRQLGYGDQYYFSRIFKKIMGISPKRYRAISEV